MADEEEEVPEYTLLNKRDAKVYKIPPATSASGHHAGDWEDAIWKGSVRIIGKGKDLIIKLLDHSTGNLFAQCVVPNGEHEKYCERVLDSSRYWVLKVVNGQRHAFIGFGFTERNDAFDFNCCLADFKSTFVDKDREATAAAQLEAPMKDMSLKEGEKITVNIPGLEGGARRRPQPAAEGGGGLFALKPPPPCGVSLAAPPKAAAPVAAAPAAAVQEDFADFGAFDDFQSAPAAA